MKEIRKKDRCTFEDERKVWTALKWHVTAIWHNRKKEQKIL